VKKLLRAVLALVLLLFAVVAALPGLLYCATLTRIEGRPQPGPEPALSVEQQNWLRCELHAGYRDKPTLTNPWSLTLGFLGEDLAPGYGDRLAGIVAQRYAVEHLGQRRMLDWHLSSAALSIWVARHWTLEQMEARAHAALQRSKRFQCEPGPDEWPQAAPGN
jgi:hypothetical protein